MSSPKHIHLLGKFDFKIQTKLFMVLFYESESTITTTLLDTKNDVLEIT